MRAYLELELQPARKSRYTLVPAQHRKKIMLRSKDRKLNEDGKVDQQISERESA
jgi:hypothetical protein